MRKMSLNRIVALVGAIAALVLGLAPVITNADWTSTAGMITAAGAITAVVHKFLDGWQKWENNPATIRELQGDPSDKKGYSKGNDVDAGVIPNV